MAISLETANTHLDAWLAADLAVSSGQSYSIGSRTLTRVNSLEILRQIAYWSRVVDTLTAAAAGNTGAGNRNPGIKTARFR